MVSDSLRPHELQHVRLCCPSPSPGVCSNSCPSSRWCHPTISSSVIPFCPCLHSFPASGSFLMSRLFCKFSIIPTKYQWTFLDFCCSCFVFQNYTECQVFRALTPFVNDLFLLFSFPTIYFMFSVSSFFQHQWMEFQLWSPKKITEKSRQSLKEQKRSFFPCSWREQQWASFILNTHPCRDHCNEGTGESPGFPKLPLCPEKSKLDFSKVIIQARHFT